MSRFSWPPECTICIFFSKVFLDRKFWGRSFSAETIFKFENGVWSWHVLGIRCGWHRFSVVRISGTDTVPLETNHCSTKKIVQVNYFLVTLYTHLKAYQQPLRQWQCINWLSNLSCQRDSDGRRRWLHVARTSNKIYLRYDYGMGIKTHAICFPRRGADRILPSDLMPGTGTTSGSGQVW